MKIEYLQKAIQAERISLPMTEHRELTAAENAMIDAAWKRHITTPACDCGARDDGDGKWGGIHHPGCAVIKAEPDWPPRISALGIPNGTRRKGSTGQTFEARDGSWLRIP